MSGFAESIVGQAALALPEFAGWPLRDGALNAPSEFAAEGQACAACARIFLAARFPRRADPDASDRLRCSML